MMIAPRARVALVGIELVVERNRKPNGAACGDGRAAGKLYCLRLEVVDMFACTPSGMTDQVEISSSVG